jgi:hypothetical protein
MSLVSKTALSTKLSLILLLADLLNYFGYITQHFIRIFVGVSGSNFVNSAPKARKNCISLLSRHNAAVAANKYFLHFFFSLGHYSSFPFGAYSGTRSSILSGHQIPPLRHSQVFASVDDLP